MRPATVTGVAGFRWMTMVGIFSLTFWTGYTVELRLEQIFQALVTVLKTSVKFLDG